MSAPPPAVLSAFGLPAPATPLAGGQDTSYLAGDGVLKPVESSAEESHWVMSLLEALAPSAHFRAAAPLRHGAPGQPSPYVAHGWSGTRLVPQASATPPSWAAHFAATRALHAALARAAPAPPPFIAARTHAWARADRLVHAAAPVSRASLQAEGIAVVPELEPAFARLVEVQGAETLPSQLVHGDLYGNVLFVAGGEPPAVIDFSVYWRSVAYAEAVVVADGLVDDGMGAGMVALAGRGEARRRALVRALLFRVIVRCIHRGQGLVCEPDDASLGTAFTWAADVLQAFDWDGSDGGSSP